MTLWINVFDDESGTFYSIECNPDEVQAVQAQQGVKDVKISQ